MQTCLPILSNKTENLVIQIRAKIKPSGQARMFSALYRKKVLKSFPGYLIWCFRCGRWSSSLEHLIERSLGNQWHFFKALFGHLYF